VCESLSSLWMLENNNNNNNAAAEQRRRSVPSNRTLRRRLRRTEFGSFVVTLICFCALMYLKEFILAAVVSGVALLSLAVRLAAMSHRNRNGRSRRRRIRLQLTNPRHLYLSLLDRDFNENDYDILSALDNDVQQNRGLTEEQINRMPVYTVQDDPAKKPTQKCSICLEQFESGNRIRTIECLHSYHADCIDRWLATKATCPVCNYQINM